ncbi:hypothetical protein IMZ48_09920 [Candidatus Bathyarchaeota archaeon]|nr:hypothetical protein [Candidatus Bathyarchaeota archaeon]
MVWVAVKRNECERMTLSERLECPLLRCRKRFGNHELMLQHLYACDELDSGEYWCYDCGHAERFTDAKCKRCLGHPTKRRKILSMAKNFFTSLGHKSRNDGLLSQLPEDAVLVPPPSYDSLDLELTNELCSAGEIHEIDSTEVPSNPPSAPVLAPPPPMRNPPPQREPDSALFASSTLQRPPPPCIFPAELDTRITLAGRIALAGSYENGVDSWINDPTAYNPSEGSGRRNSMEERRLKTRSKTLAPSSSLRSNASNSSTNTTNTSISTNSTDSTNTVSTGWSEPWTVTSGMDDSDLESPISNLFCPSKFDGRDANMGLCDSAFDGDVYMRDFGISELPADLPFFAPLSATSDHLAEHQDLLPRGNPSENGPGLDMAMLGNVDCLLSDFTNITPDIPGEASSSFNSPPPFPSSVEPSSLVTSIWETLEAHVSSSEAKLRPMRNNGLAVQFSALGSRTIASYGHAALKAMLQGRPPESPLSILCYVHVAYAYFLVVHQEEAGIYSKELFAQALAYATEPAVPSQTEYLDIARAIWEPDDVDETTSINAGTLQFESGTNPFAATFSAVGKGKGLSSGGPAMDDALLSVSRYLLDGKLTPGSIGLAFTDSPTRIRVLDYISRYTALF